MLSLWYRFLIKFEAQPELNCRFSLRDTGSAFISLAAIYTAGTFRCALVHGIGFFLTELQKRYFRASGEQARIFLSPLFPVPLSSLAISMVQNPSVLLSKPL